MVVGNLDPYPLVVDDNPDPYPLVVVDNLVPLVVEVHQDLYVDHQNQPMELPLGYHVFSSFSSFSYPKDQNHDESGDLLDLQCRKDHRIQPLVLHHILPLNKVIHRFLLLSLLHLPSFHSFCLI